MEEIARRRVLRTAKSWLCRSTAGRASRIVCRGANCIPRLGQHSIRCCATDLPWGVFARSCLEADDGSYSCDRGNSSRYVCRVRRRIFDTPPPLPSNSPKCLVPCAGNFRHAHHQRRDNYDSGQLRVVLHNCKEQEAADFHNLRLSRVILFARAG
jgi:hypothetical protein